MADTAIAWHTSASACSRVSRCHASMSDVFTRGRIEPTHAISFSMTRIRRASDTPGDIASEASAARSVSAGGSAGGGGAIVNLSSIAYMTHQLDGRVNVAYATAKAGVIYEDNFVEIIDWKTGKKPKDAKDEELRALQLALYRMAYSRFSGIPIERKRGLENELKVPYQV